MTGNEKGNCSALQMAVQQGDIEMLKLFKEYSVCSDYKMPVSSSFLSLFSFGF